MGQAGSGTLFWMKKVAFWGGGNQKVDMGFYREERVPKSHCFELTLVASRTRMNPNGYNMLNRPVLRAPAVHGVSSISSANHVATRVFTAIARRHGMFFLSKIMLKKGWF